MYTVEIEITLNKEIITEKFSGSTLDDVKEKAYTFANESISDKGKGDAVLFFLFMNNGVYEDSDEFFKEFENGKIIA